MLLFHHRALQPSGSPFRLCSHLPKIHNLATLFSANEIILPSCSQIVLGSSSCLYRMAAGSCDPITGAGFCRIIDHCLLHWLLFFPSLKELRKLGEKRVSGSCWIHLLLSIKVERASCSLALWKVIGSGSAWGWLDQSGFFFSSRCDILGVPIASHSSVSSAGNFQFPWSV